MRSGTFFSHSEGDEFLLTCGIQMIRVQAAFYGSETCGQEDVTDLMNNMAGGMQNFSINPSPAVFNNNNTCLSGGNILYGLYKCDNATCNAHPMTFPAFLIYILIFFSFIDTDIKQGAAYNSTLSLSCVDSADAMIFNTIYYITPDLACNISDSTSSSTHALNPFIAKCNFNNVCSLSVNNTNILGGTSPPCNTTSNMFLQVYYSCTLARG